MRSTSCPVVFLLLKLLSCEALAIPLSGHFRFQAHMQGGWLGGAAVTEGRRCMIRGDSGISVRQL